MQTMHFVSCRWFQNVHLRFIDLLTTQAGLRTYKNEACMGVAHNVTCLPPRESVTLRERLTILIFSLSVMVRGVYSP